MSVIRIFIVVIAAFILCGYSAAVVNSAVKTKDISEFQKVQLKSKTSDIQELNLKYDKLNLELNKASTDKDVNQDEIKKLQQEKQELENQKAKLESELQAKIETKNSIANAASRVANAGSGTASAAGTGASIETIITEAALKYGLSPSYMIAVARCESSLDPTKVNYNYTAGGGHPEGLYQFIPSTWASKSAKAGYGGASVYDATAAANVASWAFANGQSGEWACA